VNIYVAVVEALRKKERQDGTQFTTKNWWKNCLFGFVKFSFPVTRLMAYYAPNCLFSPPLITSLYGYL
jgi:hypothetical protein